MTIYILKSKLEKLVILMDYRNNYYIMLLIRNLIFFNYHKLLMSHLWDTIIKKYTGYRAIELKQNHNTIDRNMKIKLLSTDINKEGLHRNLCC